MFRYGLLTPLRVCMSCVAIHRCSINLQLQFRHYFVITQMHHTHILLNGTGGCHLANVLVLRRSPTFSLCLRFLLPHCCCSAARALPTAAAHPTHASVIVPSLRSVCCLPPCACRLVHALVSPPVLFLSLISSLVTLPYSRCRCDVRWVRDSIQFNSSK